MRHADCWTLAALLLTAACDRGSPTAPATPNRVAIGPNRVAIGAGRVVIAPNGVRYVLDGSVLRDATGRVVVRMSPQVLEGMEAALDADDLVRQLERDILNQPQALSARARARAHARAQARAYERARAAGEPIAQATEGDFCDDAFLALYNQTATYNQTEAAYWNTYWGLVSLGWGGDLEIPDVFDVTGLMATGQAVIAQRTALNFLAAQIRLADCLGDKNKPR